MLKLHYSMSRGLIFLESTKSIVIFQTKNNTGSDSADGREGRMLGNCLVESSIGGTADTPKGCLRIKELRTRESYR